MNRSERHKIGRHPCGSFTKWLVAAVCAFGFYSVSATAAQAEVRALKLHNLHTKEKAEIVFKRNGRYDQAGLKKLNVFLRDWRRNEPTKMDPRLLDLVWEAYRASGSRDYIHVVSAYRSPATNSMLRGRSRGVAKKSQHMLGKAMDFFIPGVPLKKLRDIGLKMQGGGVGYYPTSGSPFVHMDVGNVRHWPGISRKELARVFPDGKTLHVPSDGKPLPGYEQALAAYKARSAAGSPAIALAGSPKSTGKSGGLLAALFGGGADEEEDNGVAVAAAPAPKKPVATAAKKPASGGQETLPGIAVLSPDQANRAELPQMADEPQETPETIIAALPARSIPLPGAAPRPKAEVGVETPDTVPFGAADVSPVQTAALSPTPDNVPFGQASGEPAPQVAANEGPAVIPVPSFRPEQALKPEAATEDAPALLALAADEMRPGADNLAVVPTARPNDEVKALLEQADAGEYQVAAVPSPRSAFVDPTGIDAVTASPRAAAIEQPADPAGAIGGSVKTTRKDARPTAGAAKPDPKAVVVSAEPQLARWALNSGEYVVKASNAATAPRYAYNLVRTAPTEVYTTGFKARNEMAKANQFTGTAVNFLSVARFEPKVN